MHRTVSFVFSLFMLISSTLLQSAYQQCTTLITDFSQQTCTAKTRNSDSYYYYFNNTMCLPSCKMYLSKGHVGELCPCPPAYRCEKRCTGSAAMNKISCVTYDDCSGGRCVEMCVANEGTCMTYWANTNDFRKKEFSAKKFKPACDNEGNWRPKQCKGGVSGRCMCFDSKGNRLFGQATYKKSENMTCACSRRKAELLAAGSDYVGLHCDSVGNYEKLQCDSGLCWCAEPKTGELTAPVVPEKAMTKLPCYESVKVGEQYYRMCDSVQYAIAKISSMLRLHGVKYPKMGSIVCDDDGAYGYYSANNGIAYCTWRDGKHIESWQSETNANLYGLTCNCARDYQLYKHNMQCTSAGEYLEKQQVLGEGYYCVDKDGFAKTEIQPSISNCTKFY